MRTRSTLAVRMLLVRLAWLHAPLEWADGELFWRTPARFHPSATDLSRAQRTLNRLRRYPIASSEILEDLGHYLDETGAKLETAKLLAPLRIPDPQRFNNPARSLPGEAVPILAALLVPEALSISDPPYSPARLLAATGLQAESTLLATAHSSQFPLPARALAMLTLGAVHRAAGRQVAYSRLFEQPGPDRAPMRFDGDTAWLRRAYRRGVSAGLPQQPALTAWLLSDGDGLQMIRRLELSLARPGPFGLTVSTIRQMFNDGAAPEDVLASAETAAALAPLAARLRCGPVWAPERSRRQQRRAAQAIQVRQETNVARIRETIQSYATAGPQPEVLAAVARLLDLLLADGDPTGAIGETALAVLEVGLSLEAALRLSFLEILAEEHARIWDRRTLDREASRSGAGIQLSTGLVRSWLQERWASHVRPILELLRWTGSPSIARRALRCNALDALRYVRWSERDRFELALTLLEICGLQDGGYAVHDLCALVGGFSSTQQAREATQPVVTAVSRLPADCRPYVAAGIFEAPENAEELRRGAALLAALAPAIAPLREHTHAPRPYFAVRALLALLEVAPGEALEGGRWMLSCLREPGTSSRKRRGNVEIAALLAGALADGEAPRFQNAFRVALRHPFELDNEPIRKVIPLLRQYARLREPLAVVFPQQPSRCERLLRRLIVFNRLGPKAQEPLRVVLNSPAAAQPLAAPDEWHGLIQAFPDLGPLAASYLDSCRLTGRDCSFPAAVRKALEEPRRLQAELEHLRRVQGISPDRPELARRAVSLRARLARPDDILARVREEVFERLRRAAAEAQLAAIEQQTLASFRARLEEIAGAAALHVEMDDVMVNAVLLTVDLDQNRRLLYRLLRAHLSGHACWPETHPGNVDFLRGLAARGVDTKTWLGAHPAVYRLPAGGRVRLHLERDPLRILPMGSYFDTCLTPGECNAFSTVANACELNKRVVYARSPDGKIVGRKLIGINGQGALVGFRTYTALQDESANQALRAIFRRYLEQFAARCGLALSNEGTVPVLFAQAWYDDGVVPWADSDARADKQGSRCSRPKRYLIRISGIAEPPAAHASLPHTAARELSPVA